MANVNHEQVAKVAKFLKVNPPNSSGLNFYSFKDKDGNEMVEDKMYPPLNHPQALNFFFFAVVHQFGFWIGNDRGYETPLYGEINGKTRVKGSDLLWQMCMRALNSDPEIFTPERLATISYESFTCDIMSDDNGPYPFPDMEVRFQLTRAYGQSTANTHGENIDRPDRIVSFANNSKPTLPRFRARMLNVMGYSGDRFDKKVLLLAMALANRPEKFLKVGVKEIWPPIVDYHLMRISERLGLLKLTRSELKVSQDRELVSQEDEEMIREATWHAVSELTKLSGLPMSMIDETLWMARKYCPEMTGPECGKCLFDPVCKKRTKLFQPVFRTTNY